MSIGIIDTKDAQTENVWAFLVGKLSVCKVTFGAEPKDYEIYDFILREYYNLKFSLAVATVEKEKHVNPKKSSEMLNVN